MPTYDYKCGNCSNKQEELLGINDKSEVNCEKCGVVMTRQFSGGYSIVFKGTGFYSTDYKNRS